MAHARGKDRTAAYRERLKNRAAADPAELGHVATDPLSGGGPVVLVDDGAALRLRDTFGRFTTCPTGTCRIYCFCVHRRG